MAERRRVLRAAVAAALVALLAGCASIPTDGPVIEGAPVGEDVFRRLPRRPRSAPRPSTSSAGSSTPPPAPARPGHGSDRDYEVARTYLTERMASDWRPTDETVVYPGDRPEVAFPDAAGDVPGTAGDGTGASEQVTARIEVPVLGTVDASGRYQQAPAGTVRTVELSVRRGADRQWRIASTPDLALVSSSDFDAVFRAYRLYFLDPTRNFLVPDLRWFPQSDSTRRGWSPSCCRVRRPGSRPVCTTAFPSGTRMAAPQAVRVEAGVATVPLTSSARSASPLDRRLMRTQLLTSLRASLGVTQVRLSRRRRRAGDRGRGLVAAPRPDVSPEAVMLRGEVPEVLVGSATAPVPGLPSLEGLGPSHPALAYGGGTLAVLAQQRSQLRTLAPGGEQVSEPLVVSAPTSPRRRSTGAGGSGRRPPPPTARCSSRLPGGRPGRGRGGVAGRPARRLAAGLPRRHARAADLLTPEGAASVDVAAVVRDGDGRPVRLAGPLPLVAGTPLSDVRDAVWTGEDEIAVLGRPAGGTRRPRRPARPDPGHRPGAARRRAGRRRPRRGQRAPQPGAHHHRTAACCSRRARPGSSCRTPRARCSRPSRADRVVHRPAARPSVHSRARQVAPPPCGRPPSTRAPRPPPRAGRSLADRCAAALVQAAGLALPVACAGCGRPDVGLCLPCLRELVRPGRARREVTGTPPPWWPHPLHGVAPYDGAVRAALVAWKDRGRADLTTSSAPPRPRGALLLAEGRREPPARAAVRPCRVAVGGAARVRERGADLVPRGGAPRRAAGGPRAAAAARRARPGGPGPRGSAARTSPAGSAAPPRPAGPDVLLVDDVVTTGASLVAAARAVEDAGVDVVGAGAPP